MKNVKNVNYLQIDDKTPQICEVKGAEVLPCNLAWEKYDWVKKYFSKKPKQGYFVWVKEKIDAPLPLSTCVSIANRNIKQKLQNLLVVEKGVRANLYGTCNALKKNLAGTHKAEGKIILKQGSVLKYEHIHSWGEEDFVSQNYEFFLEKDAKLEYNYKVLFAPKNLKMKTLITLSKNSSANFNIAGNFSQTKAEIQDTLILKEKNASGIVKLRLVGDRGSDVCARSKVVAESESRGHLDCQGLLISKDAKISLIPELICKNKQAQLTHEASIGKISEEELNYLRMRGLTEKQAINLIVNGFLEK